MAVGDLMTVGGIGEIDAANVSLREATVHDLDRMFWWRNQPGVYRHLKLQNGELQWSDHIDWWKHRPSTRRDYIIEWGNRPVGSVSVSADGEVGIYIGETGEWNQGIGTTALELLIEKSDRGRLLAEIHYQNRRSINLFEGVGFEFVKRDGEWLLFEWS